MTGPKLSFDEAKAVVATKTAPRVTQESIEAQIEGVEYLHQGTLTICIVTMVNGWKQTGVSAPAATANFDRDVGERYAYDNAVKPLWRLEGYLLCERLSKNRS